MGPKVLGGDMEKSMVSWWEATSQQTKHHVSPKGLVNFKLLVTGMQLAKEFCGKLSNVCQVKTPDNKAPDW